MLDRLRDHPGLRFAAICDTPADDAAPAWHDLGKNALEHLDTVDTRRFAADLRLVPEQALRLPFPLLPPTAGAVPEGAKP
jgi:hypothetical protein